MKLLCAVTCLAAGVFTADLSHSPDLFANRRDALSSSSIPSRHESAVMGRRILALSSLATLSTIFPNTDKHSKFDGDGEDREQQQQPLLTSRRPDGLDGIPIGLIHYVADCEDEGNPTILAVNIATTFNNVRAGSNITLSMRWMPPHPPSRRITLLSRLSAYVLPTYYRHHSSRFHHHHRHRDDHNERLGHGNVPYSAANLPRFSLLGYLEPIEADADRAASLAACFTRKHPDARYWLPGNDIHDSEWARLVVTQVYWIGGFGDRAYIGWIPAEEWKSVTRQEWTGVRLPGETKGWSEWAMPK